MITDLDKLSDMLDNSTLARKLAFTVKLQKDRISKDIAEKGSAVVSVAGRQYRIKKASR
jgi:hypothetical protein